MMKNSVDRQIRWWPGTVALALLVGLGACGGEDPGMEPVDEQAMAAMIDVPVIRLRNKKHKRCAQANGSRLLLSACAAVGSKATQAIVPTLDNKKCTAYRYIHGRPYCVGFAMQLKIDGRCIRPRSKTDARYPDAKLGSCSGSKAWWGMSHGGKGGKKGYRLWNWASRKSSKKQWLYARSKSVVAIKKAKNPYDEKPTAWAVDH